MGSKRNVIIFLLAAACVAASGKSLNRLASEEDSNGNTVQSFASFPRTTAALNTEKIEDNTIGFNTETQSTDKIISDGTPSTSTSPTPDPTTPTPEPTTPTPTTAVPTVPLTDPGSLSPRDCPAFNEIYRFLKDLEASVAGVSVFEEYYSSEQRPILMVTVKPYIEPSIKNARPNNNREAYWMEAGLEGNACGSVTLLLSMIHMLATACPKDCKSDYYFIPVANPDGYEYARIVDPEWIKNREVFQLAPPVRQFSDDPNICYGARINYNFPPNETFFNFGSNWPCSEIYRGPFPASTPEASAIIAMKHSVPRITLSMTFLQRIAQQTSKDQLILWPLAYNGTYIPEYDIYKFIADIGEVYINANGGYSTTKGVYFDYNPQSGTSMDYWYQTKPILSKSFSWRLMFIDEPIGTKANRIFHALTEMVDAI